MWKVSWLYEKVHYTASFGATPLYYNIIAVSYSSTYVPLKTHALKTLKYTKVQLMICNLQPPHMTCPSPNTFEYCSLPLCCTPDL